MCRLHRQTVSSLVYWLGCRGLTDSREMWSGLDTVGSESRQLARAAAGVRMVQVTGMMQTSQLAVNNKTGAERQQEKRGQQRAETRRRVD